MSLTVLGGCGVSSWGVSVPALALKLPHIIVVSWGWDRSMMSSIWAVAWASVMSLLFKDWVGGRYTFIMLTRLLFGSVSFTYWQHSFPCVCVMASYFLIYIAIPPLDPFFLRSSIRLYPASCGGIAVGAIQVSCMHKMSTSSYASRMYSFIYVSPRMFMLPTLMPFVIHVCSMEFALLLRLRDPFVLFTLLVFPSLGCAFCASCALSTGGVCSRWLGRALAGPTPVQGARMRVH
jgi:hypothetical protein